jgi:hypothetical protein
VQNVALAFSPQRLPKMSHASSGSLCSCVMNAPFMTAGNSLLFSIRWRAKRLPRSYQRESSSSIRAVNALTAVVHKMGDGRMRSDPVAHFEFPFFAAESFDAGVSAE